MSLDDVTVVALVLLCLTGMAVVDALWHLAGVIRRKMED